MRSWAVSQPNTPKSSSKSLTSHTTFVPSSKVRPSQPIFAPKAKDKFYVIAFSSVTRTYTIYYAVGDKKTLFTQVLGSEEEFQAYMKRINAAARPYGVTIRVEGAVSLSRNAHKLVALAHRRHGYKVQAKVVDRIFSEQFEHAQDIYNNDDCLIRVGVETAGLTEQDIRLELADDDAETRLNREVELAREVASVEAVPCVTVLGRFKVGGYQEEHVFEKLFQKIYEEQLM